MEGREGGRHARRTEEETDRPAADIEREGGMQGGRKRGREKGRGGGRAKERDGGTEGWRDGETEELRNVGTEGRRDGGIEGWVEGWEGGKMGETKREIGGERGIGREGGSKERRTDE